MSLIPVLVGLIGIAFAVGPRRWLEREESDNPVPGVALISRLPVRAQRFVWGALGAGMIAVGVGTMG